LSGDPFPIILFAIGVGSTALIIYYGWQRWWAPVIAFAIGFTPLISNIIAWQVASWFGCYVHEGTVPPCLVGSTDIGWPLHFMAIAGLLFALTWPFAAASIVLFTAALVRTVRRRLAG
jgi:hypothetical protein